MHSSNQCLGFRVTLWKADQARDRGLLICAADIREGRRMSANSLKTTRRAYGEISVDASHRLDLC